MAFRFAVLFGQYNYLPRRGAAVSSAARRVSFAILIFLCYFSPVRYNNQKGRKMKKITLCSLLTALGIGAANAALPLTGFYQTIDDETNSPKSIVALYECPEIGDRDDIELCGRIVALYDADTGKISETLSNPVKVADKVTGSPKMVGLDIIWGMEWDDDDAEYEDGKILDPKKGSVYSSVIWQDKKDATKLNVRGKIGPFGRTQTWNALSMSDLPADLQKLDTSKWQAIIRK
jgi:hypothetical protein